MRTIESTQRKSSYLFLLPATVFVVLALFYPIYSALRISFFDWNLREFTKAPVFVGLQNFAELFRDQNFWISVRVTLVFTLAVVCVEMFTGTVFALLLEDGIAGLRLFRTLFVLPIMIAPVVVGIVWKFLYNTSYGPINYLIGLAGVKPIEWLADPSIALVAVIISDVWQWTPFVFLLVLAGLQGIPKELTEAASVDGASYVQNLIHIKLPSIAQVLGITAILRLIDAFRSLEVIYNLSYGGPGVSTEVLSLHLYKTAFADSRLGLSSSIAVVLLFLIFILSIPIMWRDVGRKER
jgi:multiple sugar transport system permease protein